MKLQSNQVITAETFNFEN